MIPEVNVIYWMIKKMLCLLNKQFVQNDDIDYSFIWFVKVTVSSYMFSSNYLEEENMKA